jgi:hypothetical protein
MEARVGTERMLDTEPIELVEYTNWQNRSNRQDWGRHWNIHENNWRLSHWGVAMLRIRRSIFVRFHLEPCYLSGATSSKLPTSCTNL